MQYLKAIGFTEMPDVPGEFYHNFPGALDGEQNRLIVNPTLKTCVIECIVSSNARILEVIQLPWMEVWSILLFLASFKADSPRT